MEVRNKLEKFLLSLAGVFLLGLIVLGFKVQADQKKITDLMDNATIDPQIDAGVPIQNAIQASRDNSLNAAAHSPATKATTTTTTATIVPGKTITQTVPVTTTSSSTKSSSTTTAAKKTKTS
jgi:cytoskeletal protein RodZ